MSKPWDDFLKAKDMRVWEENGNPRMFLVSPDGWVFRHEFFAGETREDLEASVAIFCSHLRRDAVLAPKGWELVGAQEGSPAAREQENMLVRIAEGIKADLALLDAPAEGGIC